MTVRIALAQLAFRPDPREALAAVVRAMEEAAERRARLICTPENYVPGMRGVGLEIVSPDPELVPAAEHTIREAAARIGVAAIVGIERATPVGLLVSAMVVGADGALLGYQDKVQIDPAEEGTYITGAGRHVFEIDGVRFGVVICHEGWRYPETVRACARQGAHVVFHPHISLADGVRSDRAYASAAGTMHEKAAICRAAENAIFFASVNYAIPDAVAGTAVIDPTGRVLAAEQTGAERVFIADIDPTQASGMLARRLRS
jgi:predicted amidohydrolase